MNIKKFLLILATLNSSVVIGAEFNAQIFTISGGSVSYLPFSLSQSSLVDIATSSTFIDPEIFLFSGGIGSLGDMLANDDDSCLSVDCGLVGNNQFNALINDYSLTSGDYTVALGASDLTESEARSG
ncbi:MAG: autotransporter outer membrane beta-barrel domain-containing protein, partial [Methylophaga sp.]|nr:autotransporter outer membrane beta-barrel domain-containing protein [Methylophaga sp.]